MNTFFYTATKLKTGIELRLKGYKGTDLQDTLSLATNDVIDMAVATQSPLPADITGTGVGASGALIAAILAFLASPAGQSLIAALISLLVAGG
jgi:hypothetical protein